VTSQLPVDHWHEAIANPTIADAILDRLGAPAHTQGREHAKNGRQSARLLK
jgi:hypothetical protein